MNEQEPDTEETLPIYRVQSEGLIFLVSFSGEFLSEPERESVLLLIEGVKDGEGARRLGITREEYISRLSRIKSRIEDQGLVRPQTSREVISSLKLLQSLSMACFDNRKTL